MDTLIIECESIQVTNRKAFTDGVKVELVNADVQFMHSLEPISIVQNTDFKELMEAILESYTTEEILGELNAEEFSKAFIGMGSM